MLGVVKLRKALEIAESAGLDLVEVSPNAKPPVCKILDHGKFKFEAQKKAAKARKKQKVIDIKEVKYRPNICLLYTSPSPRDMRRSRMPSSA